jgi:transcriptional regulator with PAS, ATPase and Fis domain
MENENIVVKSKIMEHIYESARIFAQSSEPILILGDSGVGKEVLAKYIHSVSGRGEKPFLAINCASLPETIIESELFGYKKGAFTDAKNDKIGLLKAAMGGTVFLDEVGDIPPSVQVKLLRVLDNKEVLPLGSTRPEKVEFRLVSATNKDLYKAVQEGRFRDDLYYRISTFILRVPPLRERLEEIPYFITKILNELGKDLYFSPEAMEILLCYPWPGNIRELRNAVIYAASVTKQQCIEVNCLPDWLLNFCKKNQIISQISLKERVKCFEKQIIEYYRNCNNIDVNELAKKLGISPASLYRKIS